jgi:hypothetical protein
LKSLKGQHFFTRNARSLVLDEENKKANTQPHLSGPIAVYEVWREVWLGSGILILVWVTG